MTSQATGPSTRSCSAFVRMFFQHGVDQARQPEPLNVTALLNMHDTAELFVQIAADHLGLALGPVVYFLDYFKLLAPAKHPGGVKLLRQREMIGLNNLRVEFKHRGTLPGPQAVKDACADARAFLEENTPLVFGIAFADIEMVEVIPQQAVRDKARAASSAAASGDLADAPGLLAEAYEALFERDPASPSKVGRFGDTIRPMREHDITQAVRPCPEDKTRRSAAADYRNLARMISDMAEACADMQRAMRVMALEIDYRQFERFTRLTPKILYFMDRTERTTMPNYAPTAAEFDCCCDFIVTAALRVAEQPL